MNTYRFVVALLLSLANTLCFAQTYDEIAYKGYVLYGQGLAAKDLSLLKQAAHLLGQAAHLKQTDREPLLWDAAMIAAMGKDTNKTFRLLDEALDAGLTDVEKVNSRPVFDFLKNNPAWKPLINRIKTAEQRYIAGLSNPTLRRELLMMWAEDQRVRFLLRSKVNELNNNWGAPELTPYYRQVDGCDSVNFSRLQAIITQQGWPKLSAVGKDGSFAAWAIVQHSNHVPFQQACIQAMKPLLIANEVRPTEYAELVDRALRNQKLKQRYGMAINREAGKGGFYPIEDEAHVDERRKAIGLEPLAVYAHLNGFIYANE